jgi:hypothetical protein
VRDVGSRDARHRPAATAYHPDVRLLQEVGPVGRVGPVGTRAALQQRQDVLRRAAGGGIRRFQIEPRGAALHQEGRAAIGEELNMAIDRSDGSTNPTNS